MLLPPEILGKIISYLDYKTLRNALQVNEQWRDIIIHQAKQRCLREIPKGALAEYENKLYGKCETAQQWAQLFDNWNCWRNLSTEVDFKTELLQFMKDEYHPTDIAILGDYIAICYDFEDIVIFNWGNCLEAMNTSDEDEDYESIDFYDRSDCCIDIFNVRDEDDVVYIHLIPEENDLNKPIGVVALCENSFQIFYLDRESKPLIIYELDIQTNTLSAHKSRISYITRDAELIILRIRRDNTNSWVCETEYVLPIEENDGNNPMMATSLSDTCCCALYNGGFYILHFDNHHFEKVVANGLVPSIGDSFGRLFTWILQNRFLVTSYYSKLQGVEKDILETHFLDDCNADHTFCKKTFDLRVTLKTLVYSVVLHGSTLVFGCADGSLVFYNVDDWRCFNIMDYSCRLDASFTREPARRIDVCGDGIARIYMVLITTGVTSVVGFTEKIF